MRQIKFHIGFIDIDRKRLKSKIHNSRVNAKKKNFKIPLFVRVGLSNDFFLKLFVVKRNNRITGH